MEWNHLRRDPLTARTRKVRAADPLRDSSNAKAFEPRDRRYIVRSMALMLPSLTQRREPPGAKAPVHSHTEMPART